MARDLESELARLRQTVRRRLVLIESRARSRAPPFAHSYRDRLTLIWDRSGGRFLRWLRT